MHAVPSPGTVGACVHKVHSFPAKVVCDCLARCILYGLFVFLSHRRYGISLRSAAFLYSHELRFTDTTLTLIVLRSSVPDDTGGSKRLGCCTDDEALAVVALADDDMPTNLPPPTYTGPVQRNASTVIDAPLEKVWAAVIDFPSYPQW